MDDSDAITTLPLDFAVEVSNTPSGHASTVNPIGLTIASHLAALKNVKADIAQLPASVIDAKPANQALKGSRYRTSAAQRHRQTKQSLWYALFFPQLGEIAAHEQEQSLNTLAAAAQQVSSTVSFHPLALVCEIRSSLRYFEGINSIHEKLSTLLNNELMNMGHTDGFLYAASPTVTGSLLLARSGHNALVYRKENLRSVLGQLSTQVLDLNKEQNRRLYNMGIRQLRDIWRLPTDGLRKRFGSEFINTLNKALGKAPEPTRNYLPPPTFSTAYDLPYELENLDRLLPIVEEMLAQLSDFLTRRDLCTSHLVISLTHEKRSCTTVDIALRQAGRASDHFLLLIETHFNSLSIPAPVIAVKLQVKSFDAFTSHTESLPIEGKPDSTKRDSDLNKFMERLRARLGDNYVKNINSVAEHCPEYASTERDHSALNSSSLPSKPAKVKIAEMPRPLWLLEEPVELSIRHGQLYHRQAISIISGPERIETYWWSGHDVRRDYYVAREKNGSCLWIFHERNGLKRWLLHGYFS